ncbi:MAG TPA: alpha/beta fold hydrolase [Anaerolineales bacterium]|nr:alpha/beta fold hydrolase [Anaerolineales bacterium]
MKPPLAFLLVTVLVLASCSPPGPSPTYIPPTVPTLAATDTPPPAATATLLPTISPTPDPYYNWSNAYLLSRTYGGGQIEFLEVMDENLYFTRYLIRYPSDGLSIYGFANIPNDDEIHPVIIALHGYIDPAVYNTLDYTTRYADALATAGNIVLHPTLRGYRPSDNGENLFRWGMAIDVLNLIALVQSQTAGSDPLKNANSASIGLWGHSMGGGISTRVITVSSDVKAAVLYAAMTGDELTNYTAIREWSGQARGIEELNVPVEALNSISSVYFFENIRAAVSIHHGTADELVPMSWSVTTCERLNLLGKNVECLYYEDMPHTFHGQGEEQFIQNSVDFFNRYLK